MHSVYCTRCFQKQEPRFDWFIFLLDKFVEFLFNHILKSVLMLSYYKQMQVIA